MPVPLQPIVGPSVPFRRVPRAQWDGSVKDVHIKEGAGQH